MTTQLSPLAIQHFTDNNGNLLAGGQLYTYAAGTSTPLATYTDSTGGTANANPVIMNARGEANVWTAGGLTYKFVLKDASGVTIWTVDNISDGTLNSALAAALANTTDPTKGAAMVGFLQAGVGAVGRTALAKLRDTISVKDFGAVGDGVADDTAAIQAAINAAAPNARVVFPPGTYKITSTLTYTGAPANGLTLCGDALPGRGMTGSVISWGGAVGADMLSLIGANNVLIEKLFFDATTSALRCIFAQPPASSGLTIRDCIFQNPTGVNSAGIQLGTDSTQVSEVLIQRCGFQSAAGTTTYGILTATGNVKNFKVESCAFNYLSYGISYGSPLLGGSSGVMYVNFCTFANISTADFYLGGGGGALNINSTESEGCSRFILGPGTVASPAIVTCVGVQWQGGICPPDDYVIYNISSKLSLIGCFFQNNRTGTSIAKINVNNTYAGTPSGSVFSSGNFYQNAVQRAPIFDSLNWVLDPFNAPYNEFAAHVQSFGDSGGTNVAPIKLDDIVGALDIASYGVSTYQINGGISFVYSGRMTRNVYKVSIPSSAWNAASTSQAIQIGTIHSNFNIVGVIADTKQAYAGLSGTITMQVGTSSGGTDLLIAKNVKTAPITQGIAGADLGVNLSSPVQGGYIVWPNGSGQVNLFATLVSGTGNIGNGSTTNLTAGTTDIYVVTETFP